MVVSSRNQHKVGIYCRLSKDDDKIGESTSITNQKNMLTDYVKEQNWLLVDIYIDDGYSGTNFNRPNFQRMLQDIEDKKIDCVLVKDQSRLGRNYIEVGNYTEYYFPKHNVRYIALSDGIDSASLQDMDIAPFKNIMNEFYAKDTSKKIKAANRTIAKNGGHKTVWPPLGYKKDPNNHLQLIIDEETSWIVRLIYNLADKGYGGNKIARELSSRLIPCPSYLIYQKYGGYKHIYEKSDGEKKKYNWYSSVVKGILVNELYLGHSVHFRSTNLSYKIRQRVRNPEEEVMIVENTHEPLITLEQYQRIKKLKEGRTRESKSGEINLFSKILKCGTCGKCMSWNRQPGNKSNIYCCSQFREKGKSACTMHYIREDDLKNIVLNAIKSIIHQTLADPKKFSDTLIEKMSKDNHIAINRNKNLLNDYNQKLKDADRKLSKIYDDYYNEKLSIRNFEQLSKKIQTDQDYYLNEIEKIKKQLEKQDEFIDNIQNWIEIVNKYKNIDTLNYEIIHMLISKIIIHEREVTNEGEINQKIEIEYAFIGSLDKGDIE
ncbi:MULTISPECIES: recombinase family protein [Bacillota]|uniref:recombinase family protein n=1 Tax=Bacillota TaxID=1239 RepID=UPI000B44A5B7|nr:MULTISPECIES: recombinase family protein [Bacillota]OUN34100.1 hypothetical protein B5G32_09365 [Massilimicrobiota sp. An80]QUN13294.1 recombinase family protein [Clostridium sp. C1]